MKKKRTPTVRSESSRELRGRQSEGGETVRLNRYLALNGIASRRRADELIQEGEVMVDGEIVTELGTKIDPARNRVEVDGVVLRAEGERKRYYLLNKPAGVVCTNEPREYRPRAVDLIQDKNKGRIYTVGRLDEDTLGLVILTNDGELAYRVSHPRYEVQKTYRVTVAGRVSDDQMRKLREGVRLSDFRSSFEKVWFTKRSELRSVLMLVLQEGRNREIRRVFAKLGLPVKDLRRVRIGQLTDRGLKVGHWRPLTRDEVQGLMDATREAAGPPRRPAGSAPARARRVGPARSAGPGHASKRRSGEGHASATRGRKAAGGGAGGPRRSDAGKRKGKR